MRTPLQPLDPESYEVMAQLFIPLGMRACPIYARAGSRRHEVIGTGVPVRGQKYAALLTASHVVDQITDGHVVIGGSHRLLRFPAAVVKFTHSRPAPAVDVDVAAIALPAEAVAELSAFYEFTGPGDLGDFDEYSKLTLYGFVGCPHTKNRYDPHKPGEPVIKPYFYVVREYAELEQPGKRSDVHVAFRAPLQRVSGADRRMGPAPDPHGISGCGVWKITMDMKTARSSRPLLVGVGIEHNSKRGVFVATRMDAGAIAIAELWKHLDEGRAQTTTIELREG